MPGTQFGYTVLISIGFGDFISSYSPHLTISLRSCIKHSRECFVSYPNTLKWVKKKLGCASFFN